MTTNPLMQSGGSELIPLGGMDQEHAREISVRLKEYIDKGKVRPVMIQGREHLLVEHWLFLAAATGLSVRIVWSKPIEIGGGEGFEARAEVIHESSGQIVSAAESMCMNNEKGKNPWSKASLYAIRSMAQTRACAKALRQKLAYIVVLANYAPTPAEEMDGHGANAEKLPREELAESVRGIEAGAEAYLVSVKWLAEGEKLADLADKYVTACVKMSSKFLEAIARHMNGPHDYRNDPRPLNEIPEEEVGELF